MVPFNEVVIYNEVMKLGVEVVKQLVTLKKFYYFTSCG